MCQLPSDHRGSTQDPVQQLMSLLKSRERSRRVRMLTNELERRRHDPADDSGDALLTLRELERYYAILQQERHRLALTEAQWRLLRVTVATWETAWPDEAIGLADHLHDAITFDEAAAQAGVSKEQAYAFADEVAGWWLARCWAAIDWVKTDVGGALDHAVAE